ncbi:unnamed protein product [Candidula unifasciata]|uniref:G-protein coupled receptors family 1 profile domain-containing protein n=1 Tax=Candidula unifasciata TaxID=100452 RepID=A0A8S3Z320_9EUPU|nr:unnamed protein product [Candidula unifasciata]
MGKNNSSHLYLGSQRDKVMPLGATLTLLLAYGVLCVIAIFGNVLVCYVILKNKRLHTATNFFIANLAISDLLVAFINVPFNISRSLLNDWPFGEIPCHLVNYSLVLTCYVSTYTLTSIALDRHRVVLKPLSRRMSKNLAISILVLIWLVAIFLSLPYGMYMRVIKVHFLITKEFRRCRFQSPKLFHDFERFLTITTFILQYCVPFSLISVAYGRIVKSLWARTHVGAVTANQQLSQARAKRKSIKLLIAVVIVFAICWLPLNMYHLLTDLHPSPDVFQYNTMAFFTCHWVAISSTCYNPFVYCWLNEHFREEVKARFSCLNFSYRRARKSASSFALHNGLAKSKSYTRSTPNYCHSSIKRDTITMATDIIKDQMDNLAECTKFDCKDNDTVDNTAESASIIFADDEDDVQINYSEEAEQGLIIHLDRDTDHSVAFRNSNKRN